VTMGAGAGRVMAMALVLSVLWPAAHGTCHEPALCGTCAGTGSPLAFAAPLPTTLRRGPAVRRRGALALSAGLRKWLGLGGGRDRNKQKQAVTEVNGSGLTEEEKLEAARLRRRALVVQDPAYRAKLQKQGTLPVQVPSGCPARPACPSPPARPARRLARTLHSRLTASERPRDLARYPVRAEQTPSSGQCWSGFISCHGVSASPAWQDVRAPQAPPRSGSQVFSTSSGFPASSFPGKPAEATAPPPPENPAEAEARRLRQLALQEDAARTLGKNAGTHSPKSSMSRPHIGNILGH
jgi:hypothetical protein